MMACATNYAELFEQRSLEPRSTDPERPNCDAAHFWINLADIANGLRHLGRKAVG